MNSIHRPTQGYVLGFLFLHTFYLIYNKKQIFIMKNIKGWNSFNEGRTMKASKAKDSDVKVDSFRDKIESHLKSLDCKYKTVGDDFEVNCDDKSLQVMFRKDYIGVKEKGTKNASEFKYTELGKVKSEITKLLK